MSLLLVAIAAALPALIREIRRNAAAHGAEGAKLCRVAVAGSLALVVLVGGAHAFGWDFSGPSSGAMLGWLTLDVYGSAGRFTAVTNVFAAVMTLRPAYS